MKDFLPLKKKIPTLSTHMPKPPQTTHSYLNSSMSKSSCEKCPCVPIFTTCLCVHVRVCMHVCVCGNQCVFYLCVFSWWGILLQRWGCALQELSLMRGDFKSHQMKLYQINETVQYLTQQESVPLTQALALPTSLPPSFCLFPFPSQTEQSWQIPGDW